MTTLLEAPFTARGFPAGIPSRGVLSFTTNDLAHALFATGRAPGDQARHGEASLWELIHRVSLVPAYLRRAPTGAIYKSALAQDLDRSEKVGLSYAIGQAMTAVYCRDQLDTEFLMHVDRYGARFDMSFKTGRSRPDLFGWTLTGDWVVAEAKGRSNGMERSLPATLAAQKSMVKTIAGQKPKLALGCVSSFPVSSPGVWDRLRVDVIDPPPAAEAVDLDIDLGRSLRAYYEPFATAIAAGEPQEDVLGYVVSRFPGTRLRVGLLASIRDLVVDDGEITAAQVADALATTVDDADSEVGQFPDGTIVQTGWDDALARQDYDA